MNFDFSGKNVLERTKSIKILHIYKYYIPFMGGIEKTIQLIAENLRGNKIDCKVLACAHNRTLKTTKEMIGNVDVVRTNSLGTFFSTPLSTSFFFNFRRLSQEADILHLNSPFPLGEFCYLIIRPKGKRLVVTYHSDISQTRWACFAPFYKYVSIALLESADRIIVTSPAVIESSPVLHSFADKCQVIPLAIDLSKWVLASPEKIDDLRDRLRIENEKIVLFVGRLNYQKGVYYLINAMLKINARLIIVGSGELKEHLEKESIKIGTNHKINFIGRATEDELKTYFSIADVFVFPSVTGGETFGLVQLEAMAYGVPVINTDLPTGVTFVSQNNLTGITVPPRDSNALANAINNILQNDEMRQRFSENCKMRVQLFSMERMVVDMQKVYEDLVNI